jgi:crotonobetainyl-CoA:carnitine CoA-transferase CaiB-like acyl-CoA transferase
MPHPAAAGASVEMIGNPIKLSQTPVSYRRPPPTLGEHTQQVLRDTFALADDEIAALRASGII